MRNFALLLCLIPLVNVIDKIPEEEALDLIDADSLPDGVGPVDALKLIQAELIPRRDDLKAKTMKELRLIVKEHYGVPGHSKTKEDELVELILTLGVEEASRLATMQDEERVKTAGAVDTLNKASDTAKAGAAAKPAPKKKKPTPKKKKATMNDIRVRDIDEVEVLKQFYAPTIVKRGKVKTPSSAPIARSIYRDDMARYVFGVAKARDVKTPGFLAEHIKILKVAAD